MESPEPNYRRRYVAFADILGFTALVERSRTDHALFANLLNAISAISQHEPFWRHPDRDKQWKARLGERRYQRYRDTWGLAFSDCLVLSESDDLRGLWDLTHSLRKLAQELLKIGVLLRGGISLGLIYHSDRTIFGPALIDAYKLESEVAIYPRIIFSDEVVEVVKHFRPDIEDPKNTEFFSKECQLMMRYDFDGLYHLDYLNKEVFVFYRDQEPNLNQMREIVTTNLELNDALKPNIRAKWLWTLGYIESKLKSSDNDAA